MSLEPDFLEMMPHTVTVRPKTGVDRYGKNTFGTALTYPARIEGGNRLVVTPQGEEKVATRRVFVGAAVVVSPEDELELPAGYNPQKPRILRADRVDDEDGHHHTVLFV